MAITRVVVVLAVFSKKELNPAVKHIPHSILKGIDNVRHPSWVFSPELDVYDVMATLINNTMATATQSSGDAS